MNRRSFMKSVAAGLAACSTNPVHFLAPKDGWHGNRWVSVDYGFGPSQSVLTIVEHDRIIYLGAMGVYDTGVLISRHTHDVPEECAECVSAMFDEGRLRIYGDSGRELHVTPAISPDSSLPKKS